MSQAYDFLVFRWDRYILTYGFFDQVGFARSLAVWWSEFWQNRESGAESAVDSNAGDEKQEAEGAADESDGQGLGGFRWVPLTVILVLVGWWIWLHRPALDAVWAYRRLRSRVEQDEAIALPTSTPPLQLADHIDRFRPPAAASARRVIDLYLRESFGGQQLSDEELLELRSSLRDALQNLRKTA